MRLMLIHMMMWGVVVEISRIDQRFREPIPSSATVEFLGGWVAEQCIYYRTPSSSGGSHNSFSFELIFLIFTPLRPQ